MYSNQMDQYRDTKMTAIESSRKWTQEETFDLLSFYRELRVLWDPTNRDYGLKSKRSEAISVLTDKFNTTESEINRKIHNLRCQFNGEVRNYNRKRKSEGTLTLQMNPDVCVSNWVFFDLMKEIMGWPNIKSRANSQFRAAVKRSKLAKLASTSTAAQSSMSSVGSTTGYNNSRPSLDTQPTDECQQFGEYVAKELRFLGLDNQRMAKLQITRVLLEFAEFQNANMRHS